MLKSCSTCLTFSSAIFASVRMLSYSTPFGITEYIGRPMPASGSPRRSRAQRLSASWSISAPRQRPAVRSGSGAQRLSASRSISAAEPRRPSRRVASVLNAFRHHGVYRLLVCSAERIHLGVLNAFRHHGVYRAAPRRSPAAAHASAQRLSASRSISAAIGRIPILNTC